MQTKISQITLDELKQEKQKLFKSEKTNNPESMQGNKKRTYIEKLKDDEIKAYFEQFDFVDMRRIYDTDSDFKAISVQCKNFEVNFSNFEIIVNIPYNLSSSHQNKFDMPAFISYCNLVGLNPNIALADLFQIELFGQRFPSYGENYRKNKLISHQSAFETLPKGTQKTLKTISEMEKAKINGISNYLEFGTFEPDEINIEK